MVRERQRPLSDRRLRPRRAIQGCKHAPPDSNDRLLSVPHGRPQGRVGSRWPRDLCGSYPEPLTRWPWRRSSVRKCPGRDPAIYVSNIRTQVEINRAYTVRERLLAMLAMFFAVLALLLAGIGLYGVLDYGVLQRRREIGIRLAIGARPADIARRVTAEVFSMVLVGAVAGIALGIASGPLHRDAAV